MNPNRFVNGLLITMTTQFLVCLVLLYGASAVNEHLAFILITITVMAFFCVSLYWAARIVVKNPKARLYIQLVMAAVFIKLLLGVALVVVYKKGFEPADNSFIWSFLFVYITSTIYEVIFLEKVGRQKNNTAA